MQHTQPLFEHIRQAFHDTACPDEIDHMNKTAWQAFSMFC